MRSLTVLPLAALLLTSACAYDYAGGYAPEYPPGYDSGMGSGLMTQPGDRFGGRNVGNVAVFEAPLAPYGQWVNSRFGRAFRPDVGPNWRPYVNGRWGENRLWVSDDPWGWATDHYGRWGFDDRAGWVWTAGTEWAPSWVAWREDEGQNVAGQNVIGWAPIPPGVNYSINLGFGTGWGYDNFNSWYAPSWVWVPRPFLYQPGFGGRVLPWRYGANYWGGSRWQYQPGFGGRPNWRGQPGRGGPFYGNRQGNWQGQRNGNWQGQPRGGWQGQRGGNWQGQPGDDWQGQPGGNWQGQRGGDWQGQPGNPAFGNRTQRDPRRGQLAVPDQNGTVGDQGIPRADMGNSQGGGRRPERGLSAAPVVQDAPPPPQFVDRTPPAPRAPSEAPERDDSVRRSAANNEGPTRPQ